MLASITALVVAITGPVLMVESTSEVRGAPGLERRRRSLRRWTVIAAGGAAAYLCLDQHAVLAGDRSFLVAGAAATLFTTLLLLLAMPLLHDAARAAPRPLPRDEPVPLRGPWDMLVLLVATASVVGLFLSPNDLGYRVKGAGMVVAGAALHFLGRPRAFGTFLLCAGAGAFTLVAHWEDPWQRTLGVLLQMGVGVVGLVWCARLLVRAAV